MATFSLTGDESVSALVAERAAGGWGPSYPSGLFEVRGELYWYLAGPWAKIAGLNEVTLRMLSAIFGIAGIWAVYCLAKTLYNDGIGLIASSFYAFSPITVGLARWGRMYSMWIFFLIIMLYFFCRRKMWLGLFTFLVSYFVHRGTLIFVPLVFLAVWILGDGILKKILYSCVALFAIFIISTHLFHNPRLKVMPAGTGESNERFIKPSFKGSTFYAGVLLGLKRDYVKRDLGEIKRTGRYFDISRFIMSALFLAGLKGFGKKDILLYGAFLLALIIMSFFVTWKWERYLAGFYPLFFIGGAKGLDIMRKNFFIAKHRLGALLVAAAFFAGINPLANSALFEKRFNWAPNFRGAYKYVESEYEEGDVVIASEVAPAIFYLGRLDYFSQEEDHLIYLYRDEAGQIRERYSGKMAIDTRDKWLEVLRENERVWFITDIIKFPYKFTEESVGLIYEKFNLVESFYLVKVFKYEKGKTADYMATPRKEDSVPLEAKFYYYSADIRIRGGDFRGAVDSFKISSRINPYYLLPYWRLGEIYMKVGLLEQGIREYEKAYEMGKGDPLAKKLFEEAVTERGKR